MSHSVAPIEGRQTFGIGLLQSSQMVLTRRDGLVMWRAASGMPTAEIDCLRSGVRVSLMQLAGMLTAPVMAY